MVKKGKPRPHQPGGKKEKLLTPSTLALIALIIMVGSVIILPNTNTGSQDDQQQAPRDESFVEQILANAPPAKMPMNDSEVYGLLDKNKTVVRFFYAPNDPASKQTGETLDEILQNSSLVVDRINSLAQCGQAGAEYIKPYCPKQAPLAIIYLPNGQVFNQPGPIEKERLLEYLSGNFTPTIQYYTGSCSKCPPTVDLLLQSLKGNANEKELTRQQAAELGLAKYPSAIVDRQDLALQGYANTLNAFISGNQEGISVSLMNNSIALSPNPHALFSGPCNVTEIKFFFSPSSPAYANESALLKGLQATASSVTIKEECLPLSKEDADTCLQRYNQTQGPIEEARKYALASAPAYVINANCRYERIIQKPFSSYGQNASAELRKQACSFGNC